jgi:CspA family cold shock protein
MPDDMSSTGRGTATVTWWRPEDGGGVVDGADLPGSCWVDAAAVEGPAGLVLRAGQAVQIEWEEPGPHGYSCRALHVAVRDELGTTPGG